MRKVSVERVRQANFTIRKLDKVSVRKYRKREVVQNPVIDIGTDRLDGIERQRRSAVDVGVKDTDPGIEPYGEQGYGHLRFQNRVQVVEQRVPGSCCPEALPGQHRGSWTKRKPEIRPTWTPSAIAPETLWVAAGKPDGNVVPQLKIDRGGASFD